MAIATEHRRRHRSKREAKRHMEHVVHRHLLHIERHGNFDFVAVATDIVGEASAIAARAWSEDVILGAVELAAIPEEIAVSAILLVVLVASMCLLCIAFMATDVIGKTLYQKPLIGYIYDPIYNLKKWVEARIHDAARAMVDAGWTIFHDVARFWVWMLWQAQPLIERWIRREITQALLGTVPDYRHIEHQIRESNRRIGQFDRHFTARIDRVMGHIHHIEHQIESLPKVGHVSPKVLTHIEHALYTHHRHIVEIHHELAHIQHELNHLRHTTPITVIHHPSKYLQTEIERLQHRAREMSARLNNHTTRLNRLTAEINHLQTRVSNARLQSEVSQLRTEVHHLRHTVQVEAGALERVQVDIPQLRRTATLTAHRVHRLDRRVTHLGHRTDVLSSVQRALQPLTLLLPLSIGQARNLNKLKNDPCQCKGLPSLPDSDVLLDTFMLETIASDGI